MSSSDTRVVVSIQASGFEDKPWEGHLATGVLVRSDQVLVQSLSPEAIQEAEGIEVLVVPLPLGKGGRVERLAVERVQRAFTRPSKGTGEFAVIDLANASRHRPAVGPVVDVELDAALNQHDGDLWAALETVGAVEPGLRDALTQTVLREMPEVERTQRKPRVHAAPPANVDHVVCPPLDICKTTRGT
ncbi:hypothetical protein [Actinophytocola oryzae]|uniref:Uncharacterized protein n=1 Tax=Actinophytocola oryzae TaxID=502181 RepID=A0A4R7W5M5_9PSEU|nr:hypothetical protein [Actinophytocola oryzae]TDV57934.1 hypothetical protein CLV71_101808 [Actinophytocola oryzae]